MVTKADRERELLEYAASLPLFTNHKTTKYYLGYTWAYEEKGVLTKKFLEYCIAYHTQKLGSPPEELLIRHVDVESWMNALDMQVIPGAIPKKCFYLGAFDANRRDAI